MLSARRNHAAKAGCTIEYMTAILGWDIDDMCREGASAYEGLCPMCGRAFKDLATFPGDLNVITIDRTRAELPPVYRLNTQWICGECNRRKWTTSIEELIDRFIAARTEQQLTPIDVYTQHEMWTE